MRPINDYVVTGLFFVLCFFSVKSEKDVFDKDKEFFPAFSHQFFGDKWVGYVVEYSFFEIKKFTGGEISEHLK